MMILSYRLEANMKGQNKEWHYIDVEAGQTVGPLTLEELDTAVKHPVFIPPENLPAHLEYLQS